MTQVLVLNSGWTPIDVEPLRETLRKLWKGKAQVVDAEYNLHDFQTWCDLSREAAENWIGLEADRKFVKPVVIRLTEYGRVHNKRVSLNRYNLFARDKNKCAYCGKKFHVRDLTQDHVVPLGQGGTTHWKNLVTACGPCNNYKDNRTPDQAGMKLLYKPFEPDRVPPLRGLTLKKAPRRWQDFVDMAYWKVELTD